jgi:hypothetical protein
MEEQFDLNVCAFLRSIAMSSQRAADYPSDTQVIDLAEIETIIRELRDEAKEAPLEP